MNIFEAWNAALNAKCVEPKQRWVGGRFGWAVHRFPIKGGISRQDVFVENVRKNNALLARLMRNAERHA